MASVSEIPDNILLDFSRKIKPEKYFEIGKMLDLNRTELEHIEHRTLPNRRETNIQMLSKWKSSQPPGEKAMETLKLVWESVQSVGTVDNGIGSDDDTSTDLKQRPVEERKPFQQESRPEKMEIIKASESVKESTKVRSSLKRDRSLLSL
ncbi:uncharacterized protein LOC121416887 [Lytechinus variegatus]|uniref:uncharacterized protein LOC121416887 n=1 Tax=Lytechinus variegatus TaxID=7654 RepID=UPI001BB257DA|nr:uncharacterized protein LOC121416887 [Lytechinus variegatus]